MEYNQCDAPTVFHPLSMSYVAIFVTFSWEAKNVYHREICSDKLSSKRSIIGSEFATHLQIRRSTLHLTIDPSWSQSINHQQAQRRVTHKLSEQILVLSWKKMLSPFIWHHYLSIKGHMSSSDKPAIGSYPQSMWSVSAALCSDTKIEQITVVVVTFTIKTVFLLPEPLFG